MINWSQMKTAEQLAAEQASARRIAISRRQGLFYLVDTYGIKEADIEAQIAAIEDETRRYKAGVSFRSDSWLSDDEFVAAFGEPLGLNTPERLYAAFVAASKIQ